MRVARPLTLDPEQRQLLEQHARARSWPAGVVEGARIVLQERLRDRTAPL
jgi:hypothetical protein